MPKLTTESLTILRDLLNDEITQQVQKKAAVGDLQPMFRALDELNASIGDSNTAPKKRTSRKRGLPIATGKLEDTSGATS